MDLGPWVGEWVATQESSVSERRHFLWVAENLPVLGQLFLSALQGHLLQAENHGGTRDGGNSAFVESDHDGLRPYASFGELYNVSFRHIDAIHEGAPVLEFNLHRHRDGDQHSR